MAIRFVGAAVLLVVSLGCGESEPSFQVRAGGGIRTYSLTELREGLHEGTLTDTSQVFASGQWKLFRDDASTAALCREESEQRRAPSASAVLEINAINPGGAIDILSFLVPGKTVIFDFYSVSCGPCMSIAPELEKLTSRYPSVVVRKVNIDRPGIDSIDWSSPVAKQYRLESIPHFKIYDGDGRLVSEGRPASATVRSWIEGVAQP